MSAPDFKPSNVFLDAFPPLCACFKKTEGELAAALIIRALQLRGDTWTPITWEECQTEWKKEFDKKGSVVNRIPSNIVSPDLYTLIENGFLTAPLDSKKNTKGPFEFTEKAFEVLAKKWVVRE